MGILAVYDGVERERTVHSMDIVSFYTSLSSSDCRIHGDSSLILLLIARPRSRPRCQPGYGVAKATGIQGSTSCGESDYFRHGLNNLSSAHLPGTGLSSFLSLFSIDLIQPDGP